MARILWLQCAFPFVRGKNGVLLAFAHELAPFPWFRQIAVAHDLTQLRSYAPRRGFAERIRNMLWIAGLKRSETVIAISEASKRDLVETLGMDGHRLTVVHEGYDPSVFRPGTAEPSRKPYLLYAGTLAPNKNIPFLLEVYTRVRERFDVDLKLVGKQDPSTVASLLAAVPPEVHGGIDFAGFVSDPQLAALMQNCAAFVFPSLNEGFGLAPVEAMACGAPVISSNAGSLREVIGEGGALLSPTAMQEWVAEIGRALSDDSYRLELSHRALRRSGDYSWDRAAEAYRALIEPAINDLAR